MQPDGQHYIVPHPSIDLHQWMVASPEVLFALAASTVFQGRGGNDDRP
jgi:hypothetical protein